MNRMRLRTMLNNVIAWPIIPMKLRTKLYRASGIRIGNGGVSPNVTIIGDRITIGERVYFNQFCRFDAARGSEFDPKAIAITIEDDVFFGFGVTVITSTHRPGTGRARAGHNIWRPVVIGAGSWIGSNVTILPGVTIAPGCVIAAGAVVTADTKPDTLYAGVPARPKRELS